MTSTQAKRLKQGLRDLYDDKGRIDLDELFDYVKHALHAKDNLIKTLSDGLEYYANKDLYDSGDKSIIFADSGHTASLLLELAGPAIN